MILTKTLRIQQSRKNSLVLWGMHHVARWAFNEGVRQAFDNPETTSRNAEKVLTQMRRDYEWLGKYPRTFLRANFIDGCKSVRLARKARRDNELPELKSPKLLFRRKQDGRQPALHSFQRPNAKGSTV